MERTHGLLLTDFQHLVPRSQRQVAEVLGISRSTIQRIHAGRTQLSRTQLGLLAAAAYPLDRDLAAHAASLAQTTLQSLGLEKPVPPPRAAPPAPPPKPLPPQVADSVLCAAAEEMNLPPQALRATLRAAFVRARELGITVEMVAAAFERPPSP